MQKLSDASDKKIQIVHRDNKSVPSTLAPKKGPAFSLFNFSRARTSGGNATAVLSKPTAAKTHLQTPRADLRAVKSWIALEERVVHDYKEQKAPPSRLAVPTHPRLNALRADLAAIKKRVALEKRLSSIIRNTKRPSR